MSRRLVDHANRKQVDGWSIASLENSEQIDDWSIEAGYCVMEQNSMMDVFYGRCSILEPMMRECGAWVREAKHRQHLIAIAELVETRKLSSWMSNDNIVNEKMWTS